MPAQTAWDWTQVFGYLESDPAAVHSPDWETAWRSVDRSLRRETAPKAAGSSSKQGCRSRADTAPETILIHAGSGWGALELRLRAQAGPAACPPRSTFPAETLGEEQEKWLALLEHGSLPEQRSGDLPGEWMVQPEWEALLAVAEESRRLELVRAAPPGRDAHGARR